MIVAFSGIDGSGKTTYAMDATGHLRKMNLQARYTHVNRDSFYHIILHKFIGGISGPSRKSLEEGLRNRGNKAYFFFTKTVKKILLLCHLLYFNLRYARYRKNVKRNIVCDRYFYDDIVQMMYLGIAGRSFISFYKNLVMEPDVVFFIKTDPAAARARKNEYDRDYFTEKCRLYSDVYKTVTNSEIADGDMEKNRNSIRMALERLSKSR